MKTNGRARTSRVAALVVIVLVAAGLPMFAQEGPPASLRFQATADATGVRLEAQASRPFEYTSFRSSDTLYVIEMSGVALEGSGAPRVLNSDVVSGYRLLPYRAMGRSMVRLEVLLRRPAGPRIERASPSELTVAFDAAEPAASSARLQPAVMTSSKPVSKAGAASAAAPHTGEASGARIERVTMARANEQVIVRVEASGKLNYQVLRLDKPERLVLDFQGATVGRFQKPASVLDPVTGIRAAQFKPEMARVVIDLGHASTYNVTSMDSGLAVTFGAPAIAAKKPAAAKSEQIRAEDPKPQVVQAETPAPAVTPQTVEASSAPEPLVAAAPAPVVEKPLFSSPAVMVDSGAMSLPKALMEDGSALASRKDDGPAAAPSAAPAPAVAQPVEPTQASAASGASPVAASAPQQKKYTGEPLSVNLKDVDLKDFFRLIHEVTGLNVVLDPAVRGTLTLVLDDVPWDQALDIVLQNNGLDKQLQGNV
ncbi:MAG TPA: AMIN domain-containing protein, partial [Candidatus Acidoferrales bacterium]|nr:AMIN domain-containing protein [Candidatus Acidoferrales bacterium]